MSLRQCCSKLFISLAFVLSSPVWAAQPTPLAVVDAVQSPAWLTREGKMVPLTPGMEVKNTDRITTGADARAYIKLAEGSTVKLGQNAQFVFYSQSKRPQTNFRGALDIVTGAFRYTTGLLGKLRQRELSVRVGSSTIGIRGTDIWGRADNAGDMAVLIEGNVEIRRGDETVTLSDPLTQYRAAKGGPIAPLAQIDMATANMLARETEIMPGDGAVTKSGRWKLALGTLTNQSDTLELYDRVRVAGFAAKVKVSKAGSAISYTVQIPSLATKAEADKMAARVKTQLDIDGQVGR